MHTPLEQGREIDLSLFVVPLRCQILGQCGERSGCGHVRRVLAAAFLGEGELEVRHTVVSLSEVLRHVEVLLELSPDLAAG